MGNIRPQLTDDDKKWVDKTEDLHQEGVKILDEAVKEALDYFQDAVENLGDRQWRKMTVSTQAVEMGIGETLAESMMPLIYNKMKKDMHKKLKVPKERAEMLRFIFVGRVIKNVVKALNERDTK